MNKHFTYSLLQYSPDPGKGERLNIGVLFLFPDLNVAEFRFPTQLQRLHKAFPGAPEKLIRRYLKSLGSRAAEVSVQPELWASQDLLSDSASFIAKHLLIPDASSIRFSVPRTAVRYADIKKIIDDYSREYLEVYQLGDLSDRKDESVIIRQFKQYLKAFDGDVLSRIEENHQVIVDGNKYEFDFSWQNGRQNLVKALSFDLKRPETIQQKTERYFGQLTLLSSSALERNWHFDLLLAKPSNRNLFSSYDRAIHVLEQVPHTEIWEGEAIERYSEKTVETLIG